MRLLITDQKHFEISFKDAADFIKDAILRKEAFKLALIKDRECWEESRLQDLLKTSACKEPWFLDKLEKETYLLRK